MASDINNLINSVSGAFSKIGKEATNMTKSVTDNVKVNNRLADQKKLLQLTYERLGRICFELNKDNPAPELEEEISKIKGALEQIADCERQLAMMKGGIPCPNCGTVLNPGVAFCVRCGTKIIPAQPVNNPGMNNTGAEQPINNPNMAQEVNNPVEVQQTAVREEQPVAEQRICPSCGASPREGAAFCSKCGAKID